MTAFTEAIDAIFGDGNFGVAAIYRPPGELPSIACTIIRRSPDRFIGATQGAALMQANEIEVRTSELTPAKGGVFSLEGGETLTVLSDPRCEDPLALVWTMTVG